MFEYFPGNYVWNLGVAAALNSGGLIDEVDRACLPIREAAAHGEDVGIPHFLRAWIALTDQLAGQAEQAEKAGHARTARAALRSRRQLPEPGREDAVPRRPRPDPRLPSRAAPAAKAFDLKSPDAGPSVTIMP